MIAYALLLAFCHKRMRALNGWHELLFLLCDISGGGIEQRHILCHEVDRAATNATEQE